MLRFSSKSLFFTATASIKLSSSIRQQEQDEDQRKNSAQSLQRLALHQLHKELQRDIQENTSANQPLPPKGWHVTRTPGSCTFKLNSICQFASPNSSSSSLNAKHLGDTTKIKQEFSPSTMKKNNQMLMNPSSSSSSSWCAKIEVFCRFETMDPSFWEPSVGLCEYVPFRVVIERIAPMRTKSSTEASSSSRFYSGNNDSNNNNDDDDDATTVGGFSSFSSSSSSSSSTSTIHSNLMIVDCAHVQSQLRIRRLFFAPTSDREALEDEAAIGMPHGVFCGPEMSHAPLMTSSSGARISSSSSSSSSSASVTSTSKSASKELYAATMELLSSCGIDNRLGEFICQSAYCFEHEEYQIWLAKLAEFSGRSFVHVDGRGQDDDDDGDKNEFSSTLSNVPTAMTTTATVAKDVLREEYNKSKMQSNEKQRHHQNSSSRTKFTDLDDLTSSEKDIQMRKIAERMSDVLDKAVLSDEENDINGRQQQVRFDGGNKRVISSSLSSSVNQRRSDVSSLTGKPRRGGSTVTRNRV